MIEPPQPGFTGVVWEAREPDRLAREISTGPGAVPMAEAGAAWGRLAAGFGAAVAEYEFIVASMRGAWQSNTSGPVLDRVSQLRDWLTDAATAAGNNAVHAETQAAAYELARLTMPHTAEIEAIQAVQRMLEQMTGALGAPLKAVAAQNDADTDLAKAAASRVMRSYEAATEPLAMPWIQQDPPQIATAVALEAEQASASAAQVTAATAAIPAVTPGMFLPGGYATAAARTLTAYRAPAPAPVVEPVETTVPQPVPVPNSSTSAMPLVPGAMAAGSGMAQQEDEAYQPRAGDAGVDALGPDLGIVSAPAVLGAPEPPPQVAGRAVTGGAP
ncbi:PPE family protein [Nocardia australiensis]|uniref:PPE family protein n=1 Tax=Nocardia australiensis TaxID=2887191 RepID=UPI001D13EBDD|nr:PPE family protein [Nocardia australiensis]